MAKGDISQAVSISAKLLAAFPDHLNASIISGNYWLKQDFPERAHSIFEKALKYHPSHPTLLRGQIFALKDTHCLLYTSPSPRDATLSRMPSSA